jgi:hypothetical protein
MRRLKLMADYGCHPLWGTVDPEIGDLDPASLPLSAALVADLAAWAAGFEATLDPDDPAASGFATAEDAAAFRAEGERLAARLSAELGPDFEIVPVL